MGMKAILALILLCVAGTAHAAGKVALDSQVFVERTMTDNGRPRTILVQPDVVTPGDNLVFVLSYRNTGSTAASNLVVTNPMPDAVAYQQARGAEVSVDGGRNWGQLAALTLAERDGRRRTARPGDVTHIRWLLSKPVPVGGAGKLTFRGIVR